MSQALRRAIQLPDGTLVRGRALRDRIPNGPLPDYGLFEPSWEADWILWLDSRTPADPQEAAHAIVKAFRRLCSVSSCQLNQVAATKASSRWATRCGPGRGAPAVPGSRL